MAKNPKVKNTDKNLAMISVILGAASFFNSIFTGIPAIILGTIALKKKVGNRTQAKLGIIFGVLGSLLIIPIIWLAIHFLHKPFSQQWGISSNDRVQIMKIAESLRQYKKDNGAYPICGSTDTESSCIEWKHFTDKYPGLVTYPVDFESDAYVVEDRPVGTLVYANRASCFLSVPASPTYLDEDNKHKDQTNFAALIYFHTKGRSCFNVHVR